MADVYTIDLHIQNRLLTALPRDEQHSLFPNPKPVTLKLANAGTAALRLPDAGVIR